MSIAEYAHVPAAWYEDQTDPSQLRWWDGLDWTDFVRPRIEAAPEPAAETVTASVGADGQATAAQLAAWPPPILSQGFFGPTAAPEQPDAALRSRHGMASVDEQRAARPLAPVTGEGPLTRRQLRELVGPLTTPHGGQ